MKTTRNRVALIIFIGALLVFGIVIAFSEKQGSDRPPRAAGAPSAATIPADPGNSTNPTDPVSPDVTPGSDSVDLVAARIAAGQAILDRVVNLRKPDSLRDTDAELMSYLSAAITYSCDAGDPTALWGILNAEHAGGIAALDGSMNSQLCSDGTFVEYPGRYLISEGPEGAGPARKAVLYWRVLGPSSQEKYWIVDFTLNSSGHWFASLTETDASILHQMS